MRQLEIWLRQRSELEWEDVGAGVEAGPEPADVVALIGALPGLDAFWKLDELTGVTAYDSSGNGHHMTPGGVGGSWPPPVWGYPAGPTGLTSAYWPIDTVGLTPTYREAVSMSAFSTNFSAGVWFKAVSNLGIDTLMGQYGASFTGWGIDYIPGSAQVHVSVRGGSFAAQDDLFGTAGGVPIGTWSFVALVNAAGTWKLYVNGILQIATSTLAISAVTGTYLGVPSGATSTSSFSQDVLMSCAFITTSVLSSTDLLPIWEAGQ